MLAVPPPEPKSIFKNPLLYSSAVLGLALLIVAGIFFSRWWDNRSIDRRTTQERSEKQLQQDRQAIEQLGGNELAIQNFYASPGAIRRGETVKLCYGVSNAKTVTLEPQSSPVWPSHARCVDVSPAKTTSYTLTIADAAGHTQSQSLEVKVR